MITEKTYFQKSGALIKVDLEPKCQNVFKERVKCMLGLLKAILRAINMSDAQGNSLENGPVMT